MSKKESHLSIAEALDAISYLADFHDVDKESHLPLPELESVKPLPKNIRHLVDENGLTEMKVREIFSLLLKHVKKLQERSAEEKETSIRQVKSIMAMVGEAAETLDRYTALFEQSSGLSVTQLSEYKRLQEFYTKRVEKQVDDQLLTRWIIGLAGKSDELAKRKARARKKERSKHVFVDLDMVKSDTEYELLLMRKEDGTRFFSPRLIRNIKLVCDFGGYSHRNGDIFSKVQDWRDIICHVASIHMLRSLSLSMERFYHEAFKHKGRDVVGAINKAFMALMLASSPHHLRVNQEGEGQKSCQDYFSDFQHYLRSALTTRDYQKFLAYPPKKNFVMAHCVLDVTQRICRVFFLHLHIMNELYVQVSHFLAYAREQSTKTVKADETKGIFSWSKLAYDYAEIVKALKHHAAGPLQRILDALEEAQYTSFDSHMQFNLPHAWYDLYIDELKVNHLRLACPTRQTQINKAAVIDEFKGFLLSVARDGTPTHHLLINLQDRTSWREVSRCHAVEQLQNSSDFANHITVVTLAIDTPFYHQAEEFSKEENAEDFIREFKKELRSTSHGYYFPEKVKKELFPDFTNKTIENIYELFFGKAERLSTKERKSFITIFHFFLKLKLIDLVNPTSFSLSCKDGIDLSGAASVFFYVMIKLFKEDELTEFETEYVESMIYGPSILIRERAMIPEVLNRTLTSLQIIESLKAKLGAREFHRQLRDTFAPLFDGGILDAEISLPVYEVGEQAEESLEAA